MLRRRLAGRLSSGWLFLFVFLDNTNFQPLV
ncbi:hypothetical protein GQ55_3G241000 [Panicum hallii var. hallii]|uniref:Uncharacterized protein n=1 Tax=Panicum hallii var. hallii TaxID=1504633 RepID=A0A2T7ECT7_9POAL|nr:hypothetical protein GQ55_3G241000 [Panicum hallii var. hallii]